MHVREQWSARLRAAACGARSGERGALDDLVALARPVMMRIAARRLRCPADAEDAVQNALLALLTVIERYDPERDPMPLLMTLAVRKSIDLARRDRKARQVPLDELRHFPSSRPRAEDLLLVAELWDRIQGLPDVQRDAMVLALIEGLPLVEAAAVSGRSVGALKVATHRARRRLLADVGPHGAPVSARFGILPQALATAQ